jgi:single-strand DNA-binding protein
VHIKIFLFNFGNQINISMSSVNKVILVGHLGKDPEVKQLENGTKVATFPLATSESYTKDGNRVENTEWHNITMWNGAAEIAGKYLTKGKLVYLEGKLRTRSYEVEGVKRYSTEIIVDNFTMLGKKSDDNQQQQPAAQPAQMSAVPEESDLPF